jgi:hypothetical protein
MANMRKNSDVNQESWKDSILILDKFNRTYESAYNNSVLDNFAHVKINVSEGPESIINDERKYLSVKEIFKRYNLNTEKRDLTDEEYFF